MDPLELKTKHSSALYARSPEETPLQEVDEPAWIERRSILWEWMLALFLAFLAALLIRALFFEAFRIPSESMEETLQVGDYVLVSKLHYGARLPISIGIPLTNLYLEGAGLPAIRMPGFSQVKRNDVIVFNVPTEQIAIDRKTHYIKRVIGLPGDSLSIVNKVPYAGNRAMPLQGGMKQTWKTILKNDVDFPVEKFDALGIEQIIQPHRRGDPIRFEATVEKVNEIREWPEIASVEAIIRHNSLRTRVFPYGSDYGLDNYGPLYIPQRGDTLRLSSPQWDRYKDIILVYEGHKARKLDANTYEIDGQIQNYYVVEQDYFFVMGDNRDSSLDSRAWGFVPKDHVVGKAILVYFSWDPVTNKTRKDRFFHRVR